MKNAREISNAEMNAHVNGYAWGKDMRREAAADPQFFHGTDSKLSEGELIAPGRPKVNGGSDPRHVYFTEKYEHAEGAGRGAADRHRTSYDKKNGQWVRGETGPHYVYQVEPTGDWGQDEQLPWTPYSHQSAHPLRVVRDVTRRDGDMHHEAVSGYDGLTGRSGMIYLDLPPGTVRLVPGGVDDHHITLVYLGKNVSDKAFEEACRRTRAAAARLGPMDGVLRGIDVFPPSKGSDGKVVAFVPAYVGSVGLLRRELEDLSASEHTDWRPHVTLAYLEEGDGLPAPHPAVPLHFDRVHVKRGDEIRSYPLGGESNTASLDKVTAMSQPEFFHGTAHPFKPGDLVVPGIQVKKPGEQTYPHGTVDPEMHHVYVSTSEEEAACHAEASAEAHYNRHDEEDVPPRVFQVRPTGPLEVDPEDEGMQHPLSWRSRHPMKVIREVNRDGERSLW
jgi:2'-5' RNA ligase